MALFKGLMFTIRLNNSIVDKMSGFIAGHPEAAARCLEILFILSVFMVILYNYMLNVKVEIYQGVLPPVKKPIDELIPPVTKPAKVFSIAFFIAVLIILGLGIQ